MKSNAEATLKRSLEWRGSAYGQAQLSESQFHDSEKCREKLERTMNLPNGYGRQGSMKLEFLLA